MKATSIVLVLMLLFSGVSIMGQQAAPVGGAPESVVQTQPKQDEPAVEAAETTEDAEVADTEAESGEEEKTGVITIEDIMVRGGWLMNVIAGLSLLAIALLFFYLLSMRQGTLYPRSFIMEAQDAAEDGDLEGLRDLCLNNGSCAAKIIGAALEQCEDGHVADHVVLRDAMEDEGGRQAGQVRQGIVDQPLGQGGIHQQQKAGERADAQGDDVTAAEGSVHILPQPGDLFPHDAFLLFRQGNGQTKVVLPASYCKTVFLDFPLLNC